MRAVRHAGVVPGVIYVTHVLDSFYQDRVDYIAIVRRSGQIAASGTRQPGLHRLGDDAARDLPQ
jgi:hypothetical protein